MIGTLPPPARPTDSTRYDDWVAELFRDRFAMLYRYLMRLSGDPALADDVAQESFVRLHRRGTMPTDPAAWLVTVANNIVRDEYRSAKRRRRLLSQWLARAETADRSPSSEADLLAQERRAAVRQALDRLPERDRRMLILRHEGFSYREIAEALGVATSSVGTLLARATAAMSQSYRGPTDASD